MRTRFVFLKHAHDLKIIYKKNTQSRAHFHIQEHDFDGNWSVWSVWSKTTPFRSWFKLRGGDFTPTPLVDSYTLSTFYNKITIFPLIVMSFSSRFLCVFGFLIYIIVSWFQTYYINSIFPLNKYQWYSYKFLRASIS